MRICIYQLSQMADSQLVGSSYAFTKKFGGICRHNYVLASDLNFFSKAPSDEQLLDSVFDTMRNNMHSSYQNRKPNISDIFVIEKEPKHKAYFCDRIGWIDVTEEWFANASKTTTESFVWTKPAPFCGEYVHKCALYDKAEYAQTWEGEKRVVLEEDIEDMLVAPNVVEVVFCKDCIGHGKCAMEDIFLSAGIEQPFCCGGNKKNEKDN